MMKSQSLAPGLTVEQQLAELSGLRDRGAITLDEYQARRAQIIAST